MERKPKTAEHRKHLSESLKERFKDKTKHPNYGKKLSEETKQKIGEKNKVRMKENWRNPEYRKNFIGNKGNPSHRKGLALEQEYGKEKAKEIRGRISKNNPRRIGINNPAWKGGLSSLNHLLRYCSKNYEWRNKVFEKDKYTCQLCEKMGGFLEAHHIIPFSVLIDQNKITAFEDAMNCSALWNIENGKTFCKQCHSKVDKNRRLGEQFD